MPSSFSRRGLVGRLDRAEARDERAPVLDEDRAEDVVLRREVVVEEAVRDASVLRDVADARAVVAVLGEDADRGVENALCACPPGRLNGQSTRARIEVRSARVQPLAGIAGRRLHALPARRVREPRADAARRSGRPRRAARRRSDAPTATAWDTALRAGSESVVCDLPADAAFAQALCARADVVLEGFRPGVAARLGVGPSDVPDTTVYCSITGFGDEGRHRLRGGPRRQLPRLGGRPRGHRARSCHRSRSPTSRPERSVR